MLTLLIPKVFVCVYPHIPSSNLGESYSQKGDSEFRTVIYGPAMLLRYTCICTGTRKILLARFICA